MATRQYVTTKLNHDFMVATHRGDTRTMRILAAQGADIDTMNAYLDTVLISLIRNIIPSVNDTGDYFTTLKLLIKLGANINQLDRYGYTPIMIATKIGSIDTVKILINSNADIQARNIWGGNCLHVAAAYKRHEIAQILMGTTIDLGALSNAQETPLAIAINNNDHEMIAILTNNK